jgi:hypothetical protein
LCALQQTADFVHKVCHEYDLVEWNTKERNGEKGFYEALCSGQIVRAMRVENRSESSSDVTAMSQGCQDQCASGKSTGLEKAFLACAFLANCLGNLGDTVVNIAIVISHIKYSSAFHASPPARQKFLSLYHTAIIVPHTSIMIP